MTYRTQKKDLHELRDASTHPKRHDVDRVVESMRRYGHANPVVVDARTSAIVGSEAAELGVVLNKLTELGGWDKSELRVLTDGFDEDVRNLLGVVSDSELPDLSDSLLSDDEYKVIVDCDSEA